MNKLSLKDIDKLIESALTNMTPMSSQSIAAPQDGITDINKPVIDFLDKSEKEASDNINYTNKVKGVITDPDARRIKDKQIAQSKLRVQNIKKLKADYLLKQKELEQQQLQQRMETQKSDLEKQNMQQLIKQQIGQAVQEAFQAPSNDATALPVIKREFPHLQQEAPDLPAQPAPMAPSVGINSTPNKQTIRVKFDTKTDHPFEAVFSERGFLIGNTRLSFEVIETALSKNFSITLDGGQGLVLDAIRMQKLLKYKDKV